MLHHHCQQGSPRAIAPASEGVACSTLSLRRVVDMQWALWSDYVRVLFFSCQMSSFHLDRCLRKHCTGSKGLVWLMVSVLLISIGAAKQREREKGPGCVPSDLLPPSDVIMFSVLEQKQFGGLMC